MADQTNSLVAGLFGLDPYQIQQQRNQQAQDYAAKVAGMDGFQAAKFGIGQGAAGLTRGIAGMMGMVDPMEQEAQQQKAVMQGADTSTPEGLMAVAKRFNDAGMPQQAAMAVEGARQMQDKIYKQQLDASTIKKNEATAYKDTNLGDAALLQKPDPTSNDEKLVKAAAIANGLVEGTPAYNAFAANAYQKLMDKRTHITIPGAGASGPSMGNINSALARMDKELKPITDVQARTTQIEDLVANGGDAATPQIKTLLADYMRTGRSLSKQYDDQNNFGNVYERPGNAISKFFEGDYSTNNKQAILKMVRSMNDNVMEKARVKITKKHQKLFSSMGIDPSLADGSNPYYDGNQPLPSPVTSVPPAPAGVKSWNAKTGKWEIK